MRMVFVRTERALYISTVNERGETTHTSRSNRPLTYEWKFDYEAFERDFKTAMRKPWQEKPRWRQMGLPLEWPPEPPAMIQLAFEWPLALAA
jgi:hypothetical protein